jgi:hypothetical protein
MPTFTPSSPYFTRSGPHQKSARWVPQLLTKEQKHERARIRQECFLITPTQQICHQLTLFLFLKVKEHLADTYLTQNPFQIIWERVTVTFITEEVTATYRRWSERNKKFICIGSDQIEKSSEVNFFYKFYRSCFFATILRRKTGVRWKKTKLNPTLSYYRSMWI